jgi:hypothetical protein
VRTMDAYSAGGNSLLFGNNSLIRVWKFPVPVA